MLLIKMFLTLKKIKIMNKKLLLSLSLLSGVAFGQSFTSANEYAIGQTQTMYLCDSAAPTLAAVTGNGVSWDYSMYYKMPNPNRTYQITANANSSFPNANKIVSIQGILDTYLLTDGTNRSSEGFQFNDQNLGAVVANFSAGDNMNIMNYDFTLGQTVNDVFSGTLTGTGVINPACSGTSVSSFDAVGTLKLSPSITKSNVQRHHLYTELNGTSILGAVILKIDQFDYFDFTTSNLPLLSFTNVKIFLNGAQATSLKFLLNSVDPTFGVGIEENEKINFSIFPNPSSNEITVSNSTFDGSENFTILDLTGKTILTTKNTTISTQNLTSGVYLLEVEKNGAKTVQKFIKN